MNDLQNIPIPTIHLFPEINRQLIELLQSLQPEEWNLPTLAKRWTVKDIAAHMLDINVRTLSFGRDGLPVPPNENIKSYQDLVDYLNELNADWVKAMKRMSRQILLQLLEGGNRQHCEYLATLNPFDIAIFSVAWAGQETSENWFHIAREYTEKMIHQLQIREAVGKPGLMTREFFYPFIDTLLCGLPHTYRNITAVDGTVIQISIATEIGGDWFLVRSNETWTLTKTLQQIIAAKITLTPETAWKLFSKGISPHEAKQAAEISGNIALAETALTMISIMG
ncbi:MAG: maleylpyruvate isomerase family mycothiol-dependent enzyme [Ferruginibacter sp.]